MSNFNFSKDFQYKPIDFDQYPKYLKDISRIDNLKCVPFSRNDNSIEKESHQSEFI